VKKDMKKKYRFWGGSERKNSDIGKHEDPKENGKSLVFDTKRGEGKRRGSLKGGECDRNDYRSDRGTRRGRERRGEKTDRGCARKRLVGFAEGAKIQGKGNKDWQITGVT